MAISNSRDQARLDIVNWIQGLYRAQPESCHFFPSNVIRDETTSPKLAVTTSELQVLLSGLRE
jgi:hypothetical protein